MTLIDGRALAERVKDNIALEIFESVKKDGSYPSLAIVLVGDRPDSKLYVSLKEKEAKKLGVYTHRYELEENTTEEEILSVINFLNNDNSVDAVLIQLPLPAHIDTDKIMSALDPAKDADGFLPNHPDYVSSPVLAAVKMMLDETKIEPEKLKAAVLYNSEVFGDGLKSCLKEYGFMDIASITGRDIEKIKKECLKADVLIVAIGEPLFIKEDMVKKEAVVIDIGTNKIDSKVIGDVDFDNVKDKASHISPVPGGVGPLTIAFLFKNVLNIYRNKKTA